MIERKILYNLTFKIDVDVAEDWAEWMKETHIPEMMATHCFENSRMNKMLYVDEDDGITYSLQFQCPNLKALHYFHSSHAQELQEKHQLRFQDKFVAFQSVMEIHEEF